ncbi:UDP-glucuronosyl/UDP-glucosyltransferase [Corchorus olitorius]|uniref:UDP-glucuronosyl/UDP-glucosyltransferase n=1 Tax=Corchorus olitorius TaxID=93759 RepID=A0A1R3IN66_9ROSI|nr:UDP-glucuronosyl/UDP-glucosyltransferase [Corchorus olitorius]
MAKVLAHHGQQVTIVMTPLNAARWNSIIDYAVKFDLNINFLTFPFPCEEVALPIGCENIDTLPSLDLADKFRQASCMLQGPLEKWLQESAESLPSCIISSQQFRWTSDVAVKFDIPRVLFHTIACFTILCGHNRGCYRGLEKLLGTGFEPVSLPGLPDEIEFNKAQALLSESEKQRSDDLSNQYYTKIRESERSADGMLLNTFEDMEAE